MKTILLTGKTGQVGWELQRALAPFGRVIALDRTQMDLIEPDAIRKTIRDASPDIIVNAAGYTAVDKAESEPELAMQVNATAPGVMAEEARRIRALLVHYSTDYVFDGTSAEPYVEDDAPNPLKISGKSKLEGERAITASGCAHVILRASWIYSNRGTNFVLTILRLARERNEITVVDDQIGSPTWARSLAEATATLLGAANIPETESGVYRLSANGYTSRFDFALAILENAASLSNRHVAWATPRRVGTVQYPLPARRPLYAATSKDKIQRVLGIEMSDWRAQLGAYFRSAGSMPKVT